MILAHKGSLPSAQLLRDEIKDISGKKIWITTDPNKIKNKLHLRYGNSSPVIVKDTEYNSPKFISLCSDKAMFSTAIKQAKLGLETPTFTKFRNSMPDYFPIIIRNNLRLSKGRGIKGVAEDSSELKNFHLDDYWAQYYEISKEYRVHVVGNRIAKVFIKKLRDDAQEEEKFPIRTNDEYKFFLIDFENGRNNGKYIKLEETSLKCVEIIGGNFCALDIGYVPDLDKYVVIEANSAPGLNELTAKIYAKYLIDKII